MGRARVAACIVLGSACLSGSAGAEVILHQDSTWTVFTDGRSGGFGSFVTGDAFPRNVIGMDANGNTVTLHDVQGGGLAQLYQTPGTIESVRVRSGFIANILGFGIKASDDGWDVIGYIQIWSFIENQLRERSQPNPPDVRQGYAKVETRYGSFLAGRARALFSRGATDIDALYAHRWGVGFPSNIDANGPTPGQIGFGVLGSGFASGLVYATPSLGGLQLTVGAYDPVQLQGAWTRTVWPREEAELTFEHRIGTLGKFVLFVNDAYQKVYKMDVQDSTTAAGVGYGGRLELGFFRLGVAGHYGQGLGLNYALEVSSASLDQGGAPRKFDGYFVQTMFVVHKVDLAAGWGITRVFLNPSDNVVDPTTGMIPHSIIKYQMGANASVVYNVRPWLHLDVDGFRAQFAWFLGEKQVDYIVNAGMTFNW